MAITGVGSYNSVYENTYALSKKEAVKKEETKETAVMKKSAEAAKKSSNEEYLKSLQKQVPYMKLQIGYGINTNNDGKVNVLDVNPKLLEKMQNDPKAAKEYTQRLKDIEAATKWVDNYMKSMGSTVIVRHCYVDENGNFSNFSISIRKDELNERLRKEAQKNAEEQIEKLREKAREKAEQIAEKPEEKAREKAEQIAEKPEEKAREKAGQIVEKSEENAHEKAGQIAEKSEEKVKEKDAELGKAEKAEKLLADKLEKAEGGRVLLDNDDMQKIIEAAREQEEIQAAKMQSNNANVAGTNLDLKI